MSNAHENNQKAQQRATEVRGENKFNWKGGYIRALIAITVVFITIVIVTVSKPNIFETAIIALAALWAGSSLKGVENESIKPIVWLWPQIFSTISVVTIAMLILNSGIGMLAEKKILEGNQTLKCKAGMETEVCAAIKAQKEAVTAGQAKESCGSRKIDLERASARDPHYVKMTGGSTYLLYTPYGYGKRFQVRFADEAINSNRKLKRLLRENPGKRNEVTDLFMETAKVGDGTTLALGLVQDTARLKTDQVIFTDYNIPPRECVEMVITFF